MAILKPNNEVDVLVELGDVHCTVLLFKSALLLDSALVLPERIQPELLTDSCCNSNAGSVCPCVMSINEILQDSHSFYFNML